MAPYSSHCDERASDPRCVRLTRGGTRPAADAGYYWKVTARPCAPPQQPRTILRGPMPSVLRRGPAPQRLEHRLLVVQEGAVQAPHAAAAPLAHHPQLLGDIGQEVLVVRHADDAALELPHRLDERVNAVHVQVVGGLVQEQHVRAGPRRLAERHAALLPTGQRADALRLPLPGHPEPPDAATHLLRGDGGLRDAAVLQQVLQRALVQVELVHVVLREAGNAQVVAAQHLALAQPQLSGDELHERALPAAILAEQADARGEVDVEVEAGEDGRLRHGVPERHIPHLDGGGPAVHALHAGEREAG
mmetsp:Transcript_28339/g.72855  ORF Transcript_28339/g.72855 Transcript_28339/m.72855 type:complete len:304 (+) Transcript_28339:148-1059(+)